MGLTWILVCLAGPGDIGQSRAELRWDRAVLFEIAIGPGAPMGEASIREHAIAWHPVRKKYYLAADVVPLSSPHHPNTYGTAIHLWSSPDLREWTYHGVAVPRGKPGVTYDGYGASSPAGMAYYHGKLYVPFSSRRTERFTGRSIGLAHSGDDPERVPWNKTAGPVSDLEGEDDDPAVTVAGDDRLHLYHRTTGAYRIVHTASSTPERTDSWPPARDVTRPAPDVRAQELTGAVFLDGRVHLFVIEHLLGKGGIRIGHFTSGDPAALFSYADPARRFVEPQPARLAYGGHITPGVRDGRLVALSWTVVQSGRRYGIEGHAASLALETPGGGSCGEPRSGR